MRALVVDDEPHARDGLARLLRAAAVDVVGSAADGRTALELATRLQPDVVFLDIQMPLATGLDVARSLDGDGAPAVVFVTAYDQHALAAFEANAVDYLVKPFAEERLAQCLARVRRFLSGGQALPRGRLGRVLEYLRRADPGQTRARVRGEERLAIRDAGRLRFVRADEVIWLESRGNYVRLHTADARPLFRGTMDDALSRLDPERFVRVSRSAAVNSDRVRELRALPGGGYAIQLESGATVRASRRLAARVVERLRAD